MVWEAMRKTDCSRLSEESPCLQEPIRTLTHVKSNFPFLNGSPVSVITHPWIPVGKRHFFLRCPGEILASYRKGFKSWLPAPHHPRLVLRPLPLKFPDHLTNWNHPKRIKRKRYDSSENLSKQTALAPRDMESWVWSQRWLLDFAHNSTQTVTRSELGGLRWELWDALSNFHFWVFFNK